MEAQDDPRFRKGIDEFNQGLFFECHETLEEIWLENRGEDRSFYQGIIQIAAGYFKWQQGVPAGAIKLWRSGLEKIEPYAPVYLGLDLEAFFQAVMENLSALESARKTKDGESAPPLTIPMLTRVS
jgi:predicted metal-dependent hydrolase